MASSSNRLSVNKTYKLYIGGAFPRTESGRSYPVTNRRGDTLAQACLASRKDLRNAVVAARAGWKSWSGKTAYNRSQILYRMGEMLEGRRDQLIAELKAGGMRPAAAANEVDLSCDRLVYYAGWCDKITQVFSSVNPVAHPHFCFTAPDSVGIVGAIANEQNPLLGLISLIAPALCGGNSIVILAANGNPLPAMTFAEIVHTSDVPDGTINILSGDVHELASHFASHREIRALSINRDGIDLTSLQQAAADNMKHLDLIPGDLDWKNDSEANPYRVRATMEDKTTWHPVGV